MFTRQQRMLLLIFAVCAAPFVAGTAAYFIVKPDAKMNYGALQETKPVVFPVAQDIEGKATDAASFKGKWWIIHTCGANCEQELYPSRQARTMLHKNTDRVSRLAVIDTPPSEALKALHPDVRWVVKSPALASSALQARTDMLLIDPLGNQIVVWPIVGADIKKMNKDMARLLRASRIG
jgi:hypothetical protein